LRYCALSRYPHRKRPQNAHGSSFRKASPAKEPQDARTPRGRSRPILPDHIIRGARVESAPIARQPVGTGPYHFAGWERGKRIRLERAPDYWGPAPGVDEIVFDVDPDAVRSLNRTRRGDGTGESQPGTDARHR